VRLGDEPALLPDGAARQGEGFLKEKPLSVYYGEIAIKGLALAQFDVDRGVLDHDRQRQIKEIIGDVSDDLSDHDDASTIDGANEKAPTEGSFPTTSPDLAQPSVARLAVICVAGRGFLDDAAAAMLAQLLQKHGIGARSLRAVPFPPRISSVSIRGGAKSSAFPIWGF
jgi:hypothetical protein